MTADPMTRQCTATAKSTGRRCTHRPMRGQRVCRHHGGSAPQAKAAVERRDERDEAERAVQTYGLPRDIAPDEALLEEVHLAERQGELVGRLLRVAIEAMGASGEQQQRAYDAVRRHLTPVS